MKQLLMVQKSSQSVDNIKHIICHEFSGQNTIIPKPEVREF